jgi:hypothetical protein
VLIHVVPLNDVKGGAWCAASATCPVTIVIPHPSETSQQLTTQTVACRMCLVTD